MCWTVGWLLQRETGSHEIIFTNVYVLTTVATVMLLRDFCSYGLVFMSMCVYYFILPVTVDGQFTNRTNKNTIQHHIRKLCVDTTLSNQVTAK